MEKFIIPIHKIKKKEKENNSIIINNFIEFIQSYKNYKS